MKSILDEVSKLRSDMEGQLDDTPGDCHRILFKDDRHLTAYYFGTNIYKTEKQLVDLSIYKDNANRDFTHHVCDSKKIMLQKDRLTYWQERESFTVYMSPNYNLDLSNRTTDKANTYEIIPTLNGLAFHVYVGNSPFYMQVNTSVPYPKLRWNDRYFAWMKQDFAPYIYMSVLYGVDRSGRTIPVQYALNKKGDQLFEFRWNDTMELAEVWFELNFHEEKLFQDTTVESRFPTQNNVYGCSSFIGETEQYGIQWLLSKPNFANLDELQGKELIEILWHIPCLHRSSSAKLQLLPTTKRFCSFGTTWESHVSEQNKQPIFFSRKIDGYLTADVTSLYSSQDHHSLAYFDGCILRLSDGNQSGHILITTGDSCLHPPILEVKYK